MLANITVKSQVMSMCFLSLDFKKVSAHKNVFYERKKNEEKKNPTKMYNLTVCSYFIFINIMVTLYLHVCSM